MASQERTAEHVLTEAARLFREQGYAAATTRELARRLWINKASLYYHVAKKEDLTRPSARARFATTCRYLRILLLNLLNWPLTWYVPGIGMTPEKLSGYAYGLYMNGASPHIAKGRVPKR